MTGWIGTFNRFFTLMCCREAIMTDGELKHLSWKLRKDIIDIIMSGGGGHIGGDMSILNTLLVLYDKYMHITPETINDPNRDRFILSKGHSMEAYYAILAYKGFLNLEDIKKRYSKFGSPYIGHPNNKLKGIEMNSGSLGHGLPVCVGMALAGKMDKRNYRVYTIMGDGELAEGSVWEGAMAASNYNLDNLCAVIDRNHLQISGNTEDVMKLENLSKRWESFNWNVINIDGDNIESIDAAFAEAINVKKKPSIIIANTTKGYGSKVMENKASWHHHLPTKEEYEEIIADFNIREKECANE